MSSWNPLNSLQEAVVVAETVEQAGAGLKAALATGPELRTIRIQINPSNEEFAPWLESARAAIPEIRGLMVQSFFARMLSQAGYEVTVGRELDIFAKGRLRSLLVEVKSSLSGRKLGSNGVLVQLDGYLVASERRRAERWLGTMGINRPMALRLPFKIAMRARRIGLIDISWMSPGDTLIPHLSQYLRVAPPEDSKKLAVSSTPSGSSKSALRSSAPSFPVSWGNHCLSTR